MSSFPVFPILTVAAVTLFALSLLHVVRKTSQLSNAPGPRGYPVIGNMLDANRILDWRSRSEIRRHWGDITSISVLGQHIVTLHTYEKTMELLGKKSLIYSSRPSFNGPGLQDHVPMLPYGSDLHECRRMLRRGINPNIVPSYEAHQERTTKRLLNRLLKQPEHFYEHLPWFTASVILKIVYGYDTQDEGDPLVKIACDAVDYIESALDTDNPLLTFPWLQYLPSWIPGAHFKKTVQDGILSYQRMRNVPFEMAVKNADVRGSELNFVTRWLKNVTSGKELDLFKESSLVFFSASVETTETALDMFFFRMQEMPDIQRKAQAELNDAVGRDRLPTFEDRQRLPYLNALCKELLRYDPPVRGGLPHQSTADDVHDGYFIPKGTIVFPSVWEMSRDITHYKDPDTFDPTRFLGPSPELDPSLYIFGFGRRLCSGMLLADTTFFIAVASVLATLNILPPSDGSKAKLEFKPGVVSHAKPFKCSIEPRKDVDVVRLIKL